MLGYAQQLDLKDLKRLETLKNLKQHTTTKVFPRAATAYGRQLKILIHDFYCLCLTLQNDASINCLNSYQQSPLAVAAAYNHVAIIEFLLKKGAEIEIKDKDGYTPLLLAASEGKNFN